MNYIPLRRPRLNQPNGDGIDWSNPINKSLVFAMTGSGGTPTDMVSGKKASFSGIGSSIKTTRKYGSEVQGINGYIGFGATGADSLTTEGTIVYVGSAVSYPVSEGNCTVFTSDESTAGDGFSLALDNISRTNNGFVFSINNGTTIVDSGFNVVSSLTDQNVIVFCWDSSGWEAYANGKKVNSGSTQLSPIANSARTTKLGSRFYQSTQNHKDSLILAFSRKFSANEVRAITSNPHQGFL